MSHLTVLRADTSPGIYLLPMLTTQENAQMNEVNYMIKVDKYNSDFFTTENQRYLTLS